MLSVRVAAKSASIKNFNWPVYDLDFSPSCPQNGSISYILRENFEVSATFLSGFTGANGADGQRKKGAVPECRLIEKAV